MTTTKISEQYRIEAEEKAKADFQRAVGTIVTVNMISGYNERDDSEDRDGCNIRVRVCPTVETDITHWVDEYLDPYWNVEPLDNPPELDGLRSFWTFGPSYQVTADGVVSAENNQSLAHEGQL